MIIAILISISCVYAFKGHVQKKHFTNKNPKYEEFLKAISHNQYNAYDNGYQG